MLKCIGLTAIATAVTVLTLGCVRGVVSPTAPAADQIYIAKPMPVPAGIISSEAKTWDSDLQHYTTFHYVCRLDVAGPAPFR